MGNRRNSRHAISEQFRIPATRQTAMRTLSELQTTEEFQRRVIAALGKPVDGKESALRELESYLDGMTPRVAALLARDANPRAEVFYMDLDSTIAVPDRIGEQFGLIWTLGALASMAFVRSAIAMNRICAFGAESVLLATSRLIEARRALLLDAWVREKQGILYDHPDIPYRHDQVDFYVMGESTPHPFFRVVPRG